VAVATKMTGVTVMTVVTVSCESGDSGDSSDSGDSVTVGLVFHGRSGVAVCAGGGAVT
jgi:hypothetical protein